MAVHRDHFDTIIKGSMEDLKFAFEGVVGEIVKDASCGRDLALEMVMTSFASDLQRSVDRFSHDNMQSTWSQFDKNQDGSLQKSEMRNVVSSLLTEIHKNLPQMVQSATEPAAENLEHWIASDSVGALGFGHATGSAQAMVLHANVQARITKAATKFSQLLSILILGLEKDSAAISDELFDTIDVDKDGKVSKREYSEGFAEAFGTVVDFSKITRLVLQQRPSFKQKQVSQSDDQFANVGAGLVVVAVAAAAFLMWRQKH